MCKGSKSSLIKKFVVLLHKASMICFFNTLRCRHTEAHYTRWGIDKAQNAIKLIHGQSDQCHALFLPVWTCLGLTIATFIWKGQHMSNICLWILPRNRRRAEFRVLSHICTQNSFSRWQYIHKLTHPVGQSPSRGGNSDQLVEKFPTFCGTWRLMPVWTWSHCVSWSWATWIQPSYFFCFLWLGCPRVAPYSNISGEHTASFFWV